MAQALVRVAGQLSDPAQIPYCAHCRPFFESKVGDHVVEERRFLLTEVVPDSHDLVSNVLVGLLLGILLRVQGLGGQALFGDEYHTLYTVEESYGTILRTFDNVGSHIVLPLLQRISLDVFGDGVLSMRLPALIPGVLTLLLLYPLARKLVGPTPACLATLALCFSPMHVYYSRFGFQLAGPHGLSCGGPHDPFLQFLELRPGALSSVRGVVAFHPAFAEIEAREQPQDESP